jgi:preprotein translocase subunit SecF
VVDLFRTKHWDLVGRRNWWFALSLLVIIPGLVAWARWGLNRGIDFTGGGLITYQLAQSLTAGQGEKADQLAKVIQDRTGIEVRVQVTGDTTQGNRQDQILVRTRVKDPKEAGSAGLEKQKQQITAVMREEFPDGITEGASEAVLPLVSAELVKNAIWSVFAGCVFILGWIRIRYFDFKWAFSGVVALVHDVLVLLGVFALTQREVNMPFVAAALTVVGFSVHDTIIIFDRIRENLRLRKGGSFAETANISLLETLARSVNTVLTVVFVLLAVYLFGGATLRDFTFAMLVGVVSGAYSSIFNASQLLVVLKNREERALAQRRALQTARGQAAKVRPPAPSQSAPRPRPEAPKPAAPAAPEATSEAGAEGEAQAEPERAKAARKKLKAAGKRKRRF